jgi:hypothetical protein
MLWHVHYPRENNKHCKREEEEKKENSSIYIARITDLVETLTLKINIHLYKEQECESSVFILFLLHIYRKKYKVIDVSDQTLKIDNNAQKCIERKITRRKKIYERDWFGSHTYNRYSSLSV